MPRKTLVATRSRKKPTRRSLKSSSPSPSQKAIGSTNPASIKRTGAKAHSKQSQLISLLLRDKGADIAQVRALTGWQAHSVRSAISGLLRKKLGLRVVCEPDGAGVRRYRIVDPVRR